MGQTKLTKTEQSVLDGLIDFEKRYKRKPSYFELGNHIGRSKSLVGKTIETLILKKKVRKIDGVSKSLEVV